MNKINVRGSDAPPPSDQRDPEINLELPNGTSEIVIRHGAAAEIDPLQPISIIGNIHSVKEFLQKRYPPDPMAERTLQSVTPSRAIITVNREKRIIKLVLDPSTFFTTTVLGKLEISPELATFAINTGRTFSREELVKLFRFNRRFFAARHDELLTAYMAFDASAQTNLSQSSDTRGNRGHHLDKRVTTNVPTEFVLNIPFFQGEKPISFRVEICLEVTDGGARFWFESVEYAEIKELAFDQIVAEDLAAYESDFPIITE